MKTPDLEQTPEELMAVILRAIRGLRFGTLEIVTHDSKVVRMEKHERIRIEVPSEFPNSLPTASAEANPLQPGLTAIGRKTSGLEKQ